MAFQEDSLLPGVEGRDAAAPSASCNAKETITRARRRAFFSDGLDIVLLAGVDVIFGLWSRATLPLLSRMASLEILVLANLAILGSLVLRRKFPQWKARRISESWSSSERGRRDR